MNLENLNKNTLKQIQEQYLYMLKEIYGQYKKDYDNSGLSMKEYSNTINYQNFLTLYINNNNKINCFWNNNEHIYNLIKKLDKTKVMLTGELFGNRGNPFQKHAFSAEVVLLSDPCLKSFILIKNEFENHGRSPHLHQLLNSLLISILKSMELLKLNKSINNEVVLFFRFPENNVNEDSFIKASIEINLRKINGIYNKKFESIDDVYNHFEKINNINELRNNILNEENLIYDIDNGVIGDQPLKFIENGFGKLFDVSLGMNLIMNIEARTYQSLDSLVITQNFNSSNIMESYTSKMHLDWTLKNINNKSEINEKYQNNFDAKSFIKIEFDWFDNLPVNLLVDLHKEGFIFDIQNLFNNTINNIYKEKDVSNRKIIMNEFRKKIIEKTKLVNKKFDKLSLYFIGKKIIDTVVACSTDLTGLKLAGLAFDVADKKNKKNKEEDIFYKFINLENDYKKGKIK
jgi:hypothetical protein